MRLSNPTFRTLVFLLWPLAIAAAPDDSPEAEPTPTPRVPPRSLAAAAGPRLDLAGAEDGSGGSLVITDHNLAALTSRGRLTEGRTAAWTGDGVGRGSGGAGNAGLGREEWQKRHRRQSTRVRAAAERLEEARAEIELLEDACDARGLSPRGSSSCAKLDVARRKEVTLASRVAEERSELDRIIRAARRDGAQPGWFR